MTKQEFITQRCASTTESVNSTAIHQAEELWDKLLLEDIFEKLRELKYYPIHQVIKQAYKELDKY